MLTIATRSCKLFGTKDNNSGTRSPFSARTCTNEGRIAFITEQDKCPAQLEGKQYFSKELIVDCQNAGRPRFRWGHPGNHIFPGFPNNGVRYGAGSRSQKSCAGLRPSQSPAAKTEQPPNSLSTSLASIKTLGLPVSSWTTRSMDVGCPESSLNTLRSSYSRLALAGGEYQRIFSCSKAASHWLSILADDERPHQVQQHGLAAQAVMDIFM